jgi:hypothetical protein
LDQDGRADTVLEFNDGATVTLLSFVVQDPAMLIG